LTVRRKVRKKKSVYLFDIFFFLKAHQPAAL
jgi:hypothetical protein